MDSNIIIWSAAILTISGVVILVRTGKRKKENRYLSALQSFAREHNSTVSVYDHWDKTTIGMDQLAPCKLFFIRTVPGKEIRQVVELSEVMGCRLSKTARMMKNKKETVNVIDRIELRFTFIQSQMPELALEFYNNDYDSLTLSGELQLAQKWLEMINRFLRNNPLRKVASDRIRRMGVPEPGGPDRNARAVHSFQRKGRGSKQDTHAA